MFPLIVKMQKGRVSLQHPPRDVPGVRGFTPLDQSISFRLSTVQLLLLQFIFHFDLWTQNPHRQPGGRAGGTIHRRAAP